MTWLEQGLARRGFCLARCESPSSMLRGASARFWESPLMEKVLSFAYDIKSDSITKARKSDLVSDLRAFWYFKEVFICSILQRSFGS